MMNLMAGRRDKILDSIYLLRNYFTIKDTRVVYKKPYLNTWSSANGAKRECFHDIDEPFGKHCGNGRWQGTFFGTDMYEHEISWLLFNDTLPQKGFHIDHINGDSLDNSITNLRVVSHRSNIQNQRGAKGFSWNKKRLMWESYIRHGYKRVNLGMHETELDARAAYLMAKLVYHPETIIL